MPKIRTFIAVKITPVLEGALNDMLGKMKKIECSVKWANVESIHITLKFLGELSQTELQRVFLATEEAIKGISCFTIATQGIGAFPSLKNPRVFWVGFAENSKPALIQLQKCIEDELADFGFPIEKRSYKPHLTIGRTKGHKGISRVAKEFANYSFPKIEITVNEILIMRSKLTPQAPIYSVQKVVQLQ